MNNFLNSKIKDLFYQKWKCRAMLIFWLDHHLSLLFIAKSQIVWWLSIQDHPCEPKTSRWRSHAEMASFYPKKLNEGGFVEPLRVVHLPRRHGNHPMNTNYVNLHHPITRRIPSGKQTVWDWTCSLFIVSFPIKNGDFP